jgi:hypothetical protein
MDAEHTQELEIEALKAIYGDDFQDVPPPKVWKVHEGFPTPDISIPRSDLYLRVVFPLSLLISL